MKKSLALYLFLLLFMIIWTGLIFLPPYAAISGDEELAYSLYNFHKPLCHQILSRSWCFFSDGTNTWIGNCVEDETVSGERNLLTGRVHYVIIDDAIGWETGVCARDISIYLGILIGLIVFPFFRKLDSKEIPPAIFYLIALIPIALDGGTQFIGLRESTNFLRLITGFIAGFPIAFYVIPMFNRSLLK